MRRYTLTFAVLILLAAGSLAAAPEDVELLRSQKVGTDGPALLEFFRQRTLGEDDSRKLEALVGNLGHRSFAVRERAMQELMKRGELARPFLRGALASKDLEVVRRVERCLEALDRGPGSSLPGAAARLLAERAPKEAIPVLLAFSPFANDESVTEAVLDALITLAPPERKVDPALLNALSDPLPARRAVAGHVVGRHSDRAMREAVRPLLRDREAQVRFRAAHALAIGRERTAVPVLITLLDDAPLALAWQIEELLFRLAGEQSPSVTLGRGAAEDRTKARTAWETWWKKHGERVDLARLRNSQQLLGLTLGIEYNTSRVWECGPDGNYRWEITNVKGPMEAWALPGNRVLIADGQGVTERDFKGNVLWTLQGVSGATGCQRLPNGNTFVSTYSSVMEYDRDGKQLYNRSIAGSNAIRKRRNGNIVFLNGQHIVEINTAGREVRRITVGQGFWVGIDETAGDRFVVADSNKGVVVEVDATGKALWQASVPNACGVARLPNGHTLVAALNRVVEVNRAGKIVWEKKVPGYARRVHRR